MHFTVEVEREKDKRWIAEVTGVARFFGKRAASAPRDIERMAHAIRSLTVASRMLPKNLATTEVIDLPGVMVYGAPRENKPWPKPRCSRCASSPIASSTAKKSPQSDH